MENGEDTVSLITMAKDSSGRFYFPNGAEEWWFLASGSDHGQAVPDDNGRFLWFFWYNFESQCDPGKYIRFLGLCGKVGQTDCPGFLTSWYSGSGGTDLRSLHELHRRGRQECEL